VSSADGPWALVRWRSSKFSYQVIEPTARFATEELAYAAAAGLTDEEPFTIVRIDRTAGNRILDDERPELDDDDLVDDLFAAAPPKRKKGKKDTSQQPASHPWRGGVSANGRADAEFFSNLQSRIPPTRIAGTGVLAAVAVADRLLAQV
jgi:hypothetical protein